MIRYYQFDLQLKPDETIMRLYAPNWEAVESSSTYQRLLEDLQPRSLCVLATQFCYRDGQKEMREASIAEIAQLRHYGYKPYHVSEPTAAYQYFGDKAVLGVLQEKLTADYEDYTSRWQAEHQNTQGDISMNTLEEMAVVNTVYGNLQNLSHYYAPEYMEALAAEEHPLPVLVSHYQKLGLFEIEPTVKDLLGMVAGYDGDSNAIGQYSTTFASVADHWERMVILDTNLDHEVKPYDTNAVQCMDFEQICDRAVELFTVRQLYQTLRYCKEQYPAEQLDALASYHNPLLMDKGRIVGERDMYQLTLNEIQGILPQMYPDVTVAPDVWQQESYSQEMSL